MYRGSSGQPLWYISRRNQESGETKFSFLTTKILHGKRYFSFGVSSRVFRLPYFLDSSQKLSLSTQHSQKQGCLVYLNRGRQGISIVSSCECPPGWRGLGGPLLEKWAYFRRLGSPNRDVFVDRPNGKS